MNESGIKHNAGIWATIVIVIGVWCIYQYALRTQDISSKASERHVESDNIRDKVNPNSADAGELALLPGLGDGLARAIVEYRREQSSGRKVFTRVEDLERVKGIGPAKSKQVGPYLIFDDK